MQSQSAHYGLGHCNLNLNPRTAPVPAALPPALRLRCATESSAAGRLGDRSVANAPRGLDLHLGVVVMTASASIHRLAMMARACGIPSCTPLSLRTAERFTLQHGVSDEIVRTENVPVARNRSVWNASFVVLIDVAVSSENTRAA
jgi:hypothetical protein